MATRSKQEIAKEEKGICGRRAGGGGGRGPATLSLLNASPYCEPPVAVYI